MQSEDEAAADCLIETPSDKHTPGVIFEAAAASS